MNKKIQSITSALVILMLVGIAVGYSYTDTGFRSPWFATDDGGFNTSTGTVNISAATGMLPNASIPLSAANLSKNNLFNGYNTFIGGTIISQIVSFNTSDFPTHSIGFGIDGAGTNWGASIYQDGVRKVTVEENGGILIGIGYQSNDAPANGTMIQGSVSIGTTNITSKLQVGDAGDGTKAWANSWNVYSSEKYKSNIQNLSFNSTIKIQPVSYNQIYDNKSEIYYGFRAEDLPAGLKVIEGNYTGINPVAIIAYQQMQINDFEARVQKLENRGILDIMFAKQINYLYNYLNLTKP